MSMDLRSKGNKIQTRQSNRKWQQNGGLFVSVVNIYCSYGRMRNAFGATLRVHQWQAFHDTFIYIFMNDQFCISILVSLKFVPKFHWSTEICFKGPIDNNTALVKIMTWRQIADKPLSEPMLNWITDAYVQHLGRRVNPHSSPFKHGYIWRA